MTRSGLSPRVRGNPLRIDGHRHRLRSIPACAGEPPALTTDRSCAGVYPRVCGGTEEGSIVLHGGRGLSPRVRGNLIKDLSVRFEERSIPACAGEPDAARPGPEPPSVYPRVCGGTSGLSLIGQGGGGLSPRVRGNPI